MGAVEFPIICIENGPGGLKKGVGGGERRKKRDVVCPYPGESGRAVHERLEGTVLIKVAQSGQGRGGEKQGGMVLAGTKLSKRKNPQTVWKKSARRKK